MTRRLELPRELCAPAVAALRTDCIDWLDSDEADERVEAATVEEVDAAGVQLLVSLSHALAARGRRLRLQAPSAPLRDACRTLGVPALACDDIDEGDAR